MHSTSCGQENFLEESTRAVQLGASWEDESPYKQELKLVRDRLNAWTSAQVQECYSEEEQEDDERKFIVQQILRKSTDFLRRIIVPVGRRDHTVTV